LTGWSAYWLALVAVLAMMTLVWLASLVRRDASIVDVYWGPGFVVAAWIYRAGREAPSVRGDVVVALVTLWGLRLALHIFRRGRGKGEDYRYREMRERAPGSFALRSLVSVFWLQSVLLWVISVPLFVAQRGGGSSILGAFDVLGLALFVPGFAFEAISDWQLASFKRDPQNVGRVMDRGLWRYSRHPNYFGDAVVWWAFFCFAAATPGGWWTVYGPLLMTLLLLRVSGVTLLEVKLLETKPAYRRYAEETNAFLPWFPRRRGKDTAPR
jgi:steroid 5-alpha reductase family enzyme